MENNNTSKVQISLRTEEINELLGRPPSRILRWGSGAIFIIITIFFVLAGVLKYSETVNGVIAIQLPQGYSADSPLVAKAYFPVFSSGKLTAGQRTIIKLRNYPSDNFGILQGKLLHINPSPVNSKFEASIIINNMHTSSHYKIDDKLYYLEGDVSVVIGKASFLARIFRRF